MWSTASFLDEGELYITSFKELIVVDKSSVTQVECLSSEVLTLSQFELLNFLCSISYWKLTTNGKVNSVKYLKITNNDHVMKLVNCINLSYILLMHGIGQDVSAWGSR